MGVRLSILVIAAALGTCSPSWASAETLLTGPARVIDGDTLEIANTRVRLFGIDAPESAQVCHNASGANWACGKAASRALRALISGNIVTCRGDQIDAYGRLLAVCTSARGEINRSLVRQGFAWAFVKYSAVYESTEAEARATKLGVFAAENEPPWEFRAHRWGEASRTAEADQQRPCPIKGNISRLGDRIYHMPWHASYDRTRIDERKGERWFCDEGQAERAGWRRAR